MSSDNLPTIVLLTAALLAALTAWLGPAARPFTVLTLVLTASAGLWVAGAGPFPPPGSAERLVVVLLAAALAVVGGGPVTMQVFRLAAGPGGAGSSVAEAGEILRGGAWVGALERAAIAVALIAGWPEGLALALAVKGLGRYPELRNQENAGTAERFLIGTFTSVLWAVGCAGIALLFLG